MTSGAILALGLLANCPSQDAAEQERIRQQIERCFGGCGLGARVETEKLRRMKVAGGVVRRMIEGGDIRLCPLLWLLGTLKAKESEDLMLRMLDHCDPPVQSTATWALGKIASHKAVDRLIARLGASALTDGDRSIVARALGEIEDPKALPALRGFQRDLGARGVKDSTALLHARQACLKLEICSMTGRALREARLVETLERRHENSEELDLRVWAAKKLADYGCTSARTALRSVLDKERERPALNKIATVELVSAIERLRGSLSDEERTLLESERMDR